MCFKPPVFLYFCHDLIMIVIIIVIIIIIMIVMIIIKRIIVQVSLNKSKSNEIFTTQVERRQNESAKCCDFT